MYRTDEAFSSRISLSSRRSLSRENPVSLVEHDSLLESNIAGQDGSFVEIDAAITATRSASIPSKIEIGHNALTEPRDYDDPMKHKEEAVLASLQCNADSLHAALMELEHDADCVHESYEEHGEGLQESGVRPIGSLGLSSITPTLPPKDDAMLSMSSSACSFSSMPHCISEKVSIATNVPIVSLLSMKPWISFRAILATVVFLSVPSGMFVFL
jgi:hypothetical protein